MAASAFSFPPGLPADPALLATLLDLVPMGIIYYAPVVDAAGTLTDLALNYLNPAAQRMTQLPAQPGTTYRQQFPTTDENGAWDFHRRSWLAQGPQQFHFYYDADGFDNYFRVTAQRVGDGLLSIFTDTSEEVRSPMEEALRESQALEQALRAEAETQRQRFYDLLMQLPAHVAVHEGADQVFTLVNPYYQNLAPGRALLGLPIREAWPELVTHGILDVLSQVYQTGEPFIATELPVQADFTRTGRLEQVYYNFFFSALRNPQGQVTGVLNFSYDVTGSVVARQQLELLNQELETRVHARTQELAAVNEQLQAANAELHESNRQLTRTNVDLDTFVYTASHDLKAPIANIESIALTLRDTLPAAVQQNELIAHLLDLLDQTTARFQFTIAQLTDLTKLQLAHAGPVEPVALAQAVDRVRLDLAPTIANAAAQLTVEVAPEVVVSFSPANLRSAIYNLLSNAVKYRAPERPVRVWIRAVQTPRTVVLTVRDNGLGLTAHQQSRLFGLFQRLHDHVEGTGVGLYITKRLVENGGGAITVESTPNVGTTFTVTLPT